MKKTRKALLSGREPSTGLQNICVTHFPMPPVSVLPAHRLETTDKNTRAVFGNYVDIYDIAQAVEDKATVPIYYESRLAKITLSEEGRKLVEEMDDELEHDELSETQKAKTKWTQLEALVGSEDRIKQVAHDIISHFEHRQEVSEGKGMLVAMSAPNRRRIVQGNC